MRQLNDEEMKVLANDEHHILHLKIHEERRRRNSAIFWAAFALVFIALAWQAQLMVFYWINGAILAFWGAVAFWKHGLVKELLDEHEEKYGEQ